MNKKQSLVLRLLCMALSTGIFAQEWEKNTEDNNSLGSVIKTTKRMYESGVDKKEIAEWLTKVVDDRLINSNSREFFSRPIIAWRGVNKVRMNPSTEGQEYNQTANAAWTYGYGNCGENSAVTYYILKKAGVKEHVRILQSGKNRSHSFAVWNMPPDADPRNPLSWGDALIVDPWMGKVLTGNEVRDNYWFQNGDPNVIIRDGTTLFDKEATDWNTIVFEELRRTGEEYIPEDWGANQDEDCFIATAVYGTTLNPKIQLLRNFRDTKLRKNLMGRIFIATYERFGPMAAFYVRYNEKRKLWARQNIVEPALIIAKQNKNLL